METPSGSPPRHSIEILSRVQAFLHKQDTSKLTLENIDPESFRILEQKADTGELPGWDSVRIDYNGKNTLVLQYPLPTHEFFSSIFTRMQGTGMLQKVSLDIPGDLPLRTGGASNIFLTGGQQKSADECIFDLTSGIGGLQDSYPVIVFKVGHSESRRKLGQDAGRLIGGTDGLVLLVATIKFDYDDNVSVVPRRIYVDLWEADDFEVVQETSDMIFNEVVRADRLSDPELADMYEWIHRVPVETGNLEATEIHKLRICRTSSSQIIDANSSVIDGEINLLCEHLFRETPPGHEMAEVMVTIPYRLIYDAICERRRDELKVRNSKKCGPATTVGDQYRLQAKIKRRKKAHQG